MIWELVKREPAWRELYGYVGLVAAMALLLPQYAGPIFVFVIGMTWLRSQPAERASAFQAGLPIVAADLFLSRVLALFSAIWLPAAAGVAVTLISGHAWADATKLIEVGAGLSVLVLAPLSSRVPNSAAPGGHRQSRCARFWRSPGCSPYMPPPGRR